MYHIKRGHTKGDIFVLIIVLLMFVSSCTPIGQAGEVYEVAGEDQGNIEDGFPPTIGNPGKDDNNNGVGDEVEEVLGIDDPTGKEILKDAGRTNELYNRIIIIKDGSKKEGYTDGIVEIRKKIAILEAKDKLTSVEKTKLRQLKKNLNNAEKNLKKLMERFEKQERKYIDDRLESRKFKLDENGNLVDREGNVWRLYWNGEENILLGEKKNFLFDNKGNVWHEGFDENDNRILIKGQKLEILLKKEKTKGCTSVPGGKTGVTQTCPDKDNSNNNEESDGTGTNSDGNNGDESDSTGGDDTGTTSDGDANEGDDGTTSATGTNDDGDKSGSDGKSGGDANIGIEDDDQDSDTTDEPTAIE